MKVTIPARKSGKSFISRMLPSKQLGYKDKQYLARVAFRMGRKRNGTLTYVTCSSNKVSQQKRRRYARQAGHK